MTTHNVSIKEPIRDALEEIKAAGFETLSVADDGSGGAFVLVEDAGIGDAYLQSTTWVGFRITFQYPYADVYPHFVRSDLTRKDGRPLGDGMSAGHTFMTRPAIQISRRSNRLDPTTNTAALKLMKVLHWLQTR